MLAEAMCKLMGFRYSPSQEPETYWQHGYSTETNFIYVTTQSLTHDALRKLSEEVGPNRTLLVCCKAFNGREGSYQNPTIKKIPQIVLTKCEWGRDDYSLRVASLPIVTDSSEKNNARLIDALRPAGRSKRSSSGGTHSETRSLFAEFGAEDEGS